MAESVSIKVNVDWKKIEKQLGEDFAKEFDYIFMNFFKGEIDKFTPFLTGQLANTAYIPEVTSSKEGAQIIYPVDYASYVYNMINANFTITSHPQARSEWDKAIDKETVDNLVERASKPIFEKYAGRVK